jgi:hypothetical protein
MVSVGGGPEVSKDDDGSVDTVYPACLLAATEAKSAARFCATAAETGGIAAVAMACVGGAGDVAGIGILLPEGAEPGACAHVTVCRVGGVGEGAPVYAVAGALES